MGTVAVSPTLRPGGNVCPPAYRRRHPRATSLYQLLDVHYETVKGVWEERFERQYGFWRGRWDSAVCPLFIHPAALLLIILARGVRICAESGRNGTACRAWNLS